MPLVHGTRKVAVLAQMPRQPLADVLPARKIPGRSAQSLGQRILPLRNRDQVDVVAHQAVSEEIEPVALTAVPQGIEVHLTVQIAEEDRLLLVAPLGNVMRQAGNDDSRKTSH